MRTPCVYFCICYNKLIKIGGVFVSDYQLDRYTLSQKFLLSFLNCVEDDTFHERERLPSERELASMFGISRQCLREAMQLLASHGVVCIQQGSGTYIREGALKQLHELIDTDVITPLSRDDFEQFMEAREIIENNSIALAVRRATPEMIRRLEDLVNDMEKCLENYDSFRLLDAKFHILLILATQNKILIHSFSTIRTSLYSYYKQIRSVIPNEEFLHQVSHSDHKRILECMYNRDEETARNIMRYHMWSSRSMLKKYFERLSEM